MECEHKKVCDVAIKIEKDKKYVTVTWQSKCKLCGEWACDPYSILYKQVRI